MCATCGKRCDREGGLLAAAHQLERHRRHRDAVDREGHASRWVSRRSTRRDNGREDHGLAHGRRIERWSQCRGRCLQGRRVDRLSRERSAAGAHIVVAAVRRRDRVRSGRERRGGETGLVGVTNDSEVHGSLCLAVDRKGHLARRCSLVRRRSHDGRERHCLSQRRWIVRRYQRRGRCQQSRHWTD